MLLLQEPGITNTGRPPSANQFEGFFPCNHRPKAAIYVRKGYNLHPKVIMTSGDNAISVAVTIRGQRTEIINVYAPRKIETKEALAKNLPLPNCHLGGDFNTHHANWYGPLAADRAKIIGKCIPSATF